MSYDADKANLYATLDADRNQLAGWVQNNINAAVKVLDAQMSARFAVLTSVVQQLAAGQGATVDMAAVEAVVEKGVAAAIAGITTTLEIKPGPTT